MRMRGGYGAERRERPMDQAARDRLLLGVPVKARRLDVDGVATSVLEGGEGPPLVLLHGGIVSGAVYWAPVISGFAESHRVVVPDVPGLGESDPVPRLDNAAFARWFAALLRLTCPDKPALIVHSTTGTLAARFAAQQGDLLRQLVIYGVPGVGPYEMPRGLLFTAIRFALRPSEVNLERFDRWALLEPDQTRQQDPEWYEAFSAYRRSRAAVPHVKRTMRQLIGLGTKQVPDTELRRIGVPTALVWGRHDRMAPLNLAEGAKARMGWPLHVIEHAGHVPHLERSDAFLDAVAAVTRQQGRL